MTKLQQGFGVRGNLFGPSRHHLQVGIAGAQRFFVRTKNLAIIAEQLVTKKIEKTTTAFAGTSDQVDIGIGKEHNSPNIEIFGRIFLFNCIESQLAAASAVVALQMTIVDNSIND